MSAARAITILTIVTVVIGLAGPRALAQSGSQTQGNSGFQVPADVRSIFDDSCVECHGGKNPAAGVSYATDSDLRSLVGEQASEAKKYQMINPGHPDESYIVMKIKGASGIVGSRMPLTGGYLSNAQIKTIADWIAGMGGPSSPSQQSGQSQQSAPSPPSGSDPPKSPSSPTSASSGSRGESKQAMAVGQLFDGAYVFMRRCSGCHGESGEGISLFGPPLAGNAFITTGTMETIGEVILNGRKYGDMHYPEYSGMPAWQFIRGGELEALINYLKGPLQGE